MKLKFTKMQGAGNDFVVIDAVTQHINFDTAQWKFLADRRFGIGADQILVVEESRTPDVDFSYRIYNADGGEVEQCGNGSRAFVKFVTEKKLTEKRSIKVETLAGILVLTLDADGNVTVNMGAPVLLPDLVPFDTHGLDGVIEGRDTLWPLDLGDTAANRQIHISALSMGNPHAVQVVLDLEKANLAVDGPLIEHHPRFPRRVNAGFMQIVNRHHVKLRVFERGAGETLACGTGACAAVVAGIRRGLLDSPVQVAMRGGNLSIAWAGENQAAMMTGPAVRVFDGEIEI